MRIDLLPTTLRASLLLVLVALPAAAQTTTIMVPFSPSDTTERFIAPEDQTGRLTVVPSVLYPGENRLTLTSPVGIRSITVLPGTNLVEVRSAGNLKGCPTSDLIELTVNTASQPVNLTLVVEPCDGSAPDRIRISLNTVWNLDEVLFPDIRVGEEVCRQFQIRLDGSVIGLTSASLPGNFLDSVTSSDRRLSFEFPDPLPVHIPRGTTYRYNVCFRADEPGTYRFPVITWIRRDEPAGGFTTYPVADTGVIRVLPEEERTMLEILEIEEGEPTEAEQIDPSISDSAAGLEVDSIGSPGLTTVAPPQPTPATATAETTATPITVIRRVSLQGRKE